MPEERKIGLSEVGKAIATSVAEKRKISVAEVRRTIATSLAAAFGFVIALMWNNVVVGALGVAGISLTAGMGFVSWAYLVATALAMTVVLVLLIVVVSRWGGRT